MSAPSPDITALLAELRGVHREALDYLDHNDLETFHAAAAESNARFDEEVEEILTERGRSRELRGKRGLIQ